MLFYICPSHRNQNVLIVTCRSTNMRRTFYFPTFCIHFIYAHLPAKSNPWNILRNISPQFCFCKYICLFGHVYHIRFVYYCQSLFVYIYQTICENPGRVFICSPKAKCSSVIIYLITERHPAASKANRRHIHHWLISWYLQGSLHRPGNTPSQIWWMYGILL